MDEDSDVDDAAIALRLPPLAPAPVGGGESGDAPPAYIPQLPIEIIMKIFYSLETSQVLAFSRVSKAFRAVTEDPHCIAEHFIQQHYPHSIFRAISYSRTFTAEVFDNLIKRGAPLSRSLVQELGRGRFGACPSSRYRYYDEEFHDFPYYPTSWGLKLKFSACLAVMKKGEEMYGDGVRFEHLQSDEETVATLTEGTLWSAWSRDSTSLRELMEQGRYLPLPRHEGLTRGETFISRIMAKFPDVVPLALGPCQWEPTGEQRRQALSTVFMCLDQPEGIDACAKILEKAEQLRQYPGFDLTFELASDVVRDSLDADNLRPLRAASIDGFEKQVKVRDGYRALLQLDEKGALDFKLASVVDAAVRKDWTREWPLSSFKALQKAARDFPSNSLLMATPVLLALCQYIQKHGRGAINFGTELECVRITDVSIANTLLSRSITNVDLVLDIAAEVIPDFDEGALVRSTLPKLLCQPFREGILLALHRRRPDFAGMLEEALMVQDFHIQELTAATNHPKLRCHFYKFGQPAASPAPRAAGDAPGMRSILSFETAYRSYSRHDWFSTRALNCKYKSFFTNFWKLNGHTAPGADGAAQDDLIPGPNIFGLTPSFPAEPAQPADSDASGQSSSTAGPSTAPSHGAREQQPTVEPEASHFIFPGHFHNKQSVECVQILGRSPAASLVLSHALINGAGSELMSALVTAMKPLSFDLGHWKLLAWLGQAPPQVMVDAIAYGAPFSTDGNPCDIPRYDMHLLNTKRRIAKGEKALARKIAGAEGDGSSAAAAAAARTPPRFNAARDLKGKETKLALLEAEGKAAASWDAHYPPKTAEDRTAAYTKPSEDHRPVRIGFGRSVVYLSEDETRRRLKSITEWIDHLEGLLRLELKLHSLEVFLAAESGEARAVEKTAFLRELERKYAGAPLPMLRGTQRELQRTVDQFEKHALAKRADAGDFGAALTLELAALEEDFEKHHEAMPALNPDGSKPHAAKRRCVDAKPGRRQSKRVRMAEDDRYEDSADETFDIDRELARERLRKMRARRERVRSKRAAATAAVEGDADLAPDAASGGSGSCLEPGDDDSADDSSDGDIDDEDVEE
ncbi:uncharacterized protein PSFLO_04115 [Pseudozyma flocculosa]|uniref:F-box domain-containing protein n=1 Tax=Pseudozyma flocculosa TaxID=84751 RepID=A0A5C3F3X9_9BASI|nr:uncharacterized protein PSFLO_04115 [Pseudozyma flocculosa]